MVGGVGFSANTLSYTHTHTHTEITHTTSSRRRRTSQPGSESKRTVGRRNRDFNMFRCSIVSLSVQLARLGRGFSLLTNYGVDRRACVWSVWPQVKCSLVPRTVVVPPLASSREPEAGSFVQSGQKVSIFPGIKLRRPDIRNPSVRPRPVAGPGSLQQKQQHRLGSA